MDKTQSGSRSSLLGIFINILLPVLILDYCSAGPANPLERAAGESFWHIGPVWALVIALSLPLVYGIRSLVVTKKFDLMSGVGMAGVLLTGIISIFVIGPGGRIHGATPWLFAGKEALIPLILAAAVIVSRSTSVPLLNMFIYTPELFDVPRIEQAVASSGRERDYQRLLAGSLDSGGNARGVLHRQFLPESLLHVLRHAPARRRTAGGLQRSHRQHYLVGFPDHRGAHPGRPRLDHDTPHQTARTVDRSHTGRTSS